MRNTNTKFYDMKTIKKVWTSIFLWVFIFTNLIPANILAEWNNDTVVYPLKKISKSSCRFQKFSELTEDCKKDLPILNTKDYKKYLSENDWYNEMTRTYTELWWASYKYWWDQWNWWHIWTDIATAEWTPVYSIANWKVIVAENLVWHWNVISIEHKIRWKIVVSDYAHLSVMNVAVWDTVSVWDKIWEVWSTWNSTWNHLHFEIDLESSTNSYPYYYDYKTCPYSYYEITESWTCFNELSNNTVDPLLFLETGWAILDQITRKVTKIDIKKEVPKPIVTTNFNESEVDLTIFDRTVYKDYDVNDIKRVQQVLTKIWRYSWWITWKYEDIENIIFNYQVEKGLLKTKQDDWAWWFWPKTRLLIKNDYSLITWKVVVNTPVSVADSGIDSSIVDNLIKDTPEVKEVKIKTEKISKENMLTREQIEEREVKDFLNKYNIDLKFEKTWWNVEIWKEAIINLLVTDNKGKPFVWNMPWWMTFAMDKSKLSVFPEKLFNFTDWKREIKLTWLKDWNTKLDIKIWDKVVKSFDTKVYSSKTVIYPKWWNITSDNTVVLWDSRTWFVTFVDENNRKMVNLPYGGEYRLKWSDWTKICIKRWEAKDMEEIANRRCKPENYINEVAFSYKDTVSWLLIFDYKVAWKNTNIELINSKNVILNKKSIVVSTPKWLNNSYIYQSEVLSMLENRVVEWINKWYFQQDSKLTQDSSIAWIENGLKNMKNSNLDKGNIKKIDESLKKLKEEKRDKTIVVSRKEFLDKVYTYMIFDKNSSSTNRKYLDLDEEYNKKANLVFDKDNTWKDQFWVNYYRPNEPITRWETAFLLSKVIDKNKKVYLTLR